MTALLAERGLSVVEAARRLETDGPNEVPPAAPPRVVRLIGRQLVDPLVALLLAAATVTAVLRDGTDTAVIVFVVVVNTAIGVTQEIRAQRAIAALQKLGAPTAQVLRDGADRVVPAAGLVRGDLVLLTAGDVVPADLTLTQAQRLRLDESMVTGESATVARTAGQDVAAGTVVVTGRGQGTVARVGPASALGRIAELVAATRPGPTPLQHRLARLGRILGVVAVLVSALVLALGLLAGRPLVEMAVVAVSLVVAAVPESLPAVVTLALALGAYRMARGHAVARKLHAVETLGSVSVLACDKTGTLTQGRMAVERAVTPDGVLVTVHGTGYQPAGEIVRADATDADRPNPAALTDLARAAVLCNDARLSAPRSGHPNWTAVGDPLEAALLAFAGRCGIDAGAERDAAPRIAEEPFDAETRRMITFHSTPDGRTLAVCKGAPEAVLNAGTVDTPPAELAGILDQGRALAASGARVMALASGWVDGPELPREPALQPRGLVAIADPVRPEATAVAHALAGAGIRLILITGDHPATATAIAAGLGIWQDGDPVVRGDTGDLGAPARVYARILPEQKLAIVAALQRTGQVVAMTGDGVNDAPALRRADIGVAMGAGGTEVARQAADLVLTDDNLATVTDAVREGRRIYDNIRRFLRYALSGGLAELAIMLAGPFLGLAVPLLPAQILWINLLTHGLPGVALAAEPASPGIMDRPPRPTEESILGAGLARTVLGLGALIAGTVLAAGIVAAHAALPWQSVVFVTLGFAQLGVALAVRARRSRGGGRNAGLIAAVASSAILQIAAVTWTPLRELLSTESLTLTQVAGCIVVAAVPGAVLAVTRAVGRHRRPGSRGHGRSSTSSGPKATRRGAAS